MQAISLNSSVLRAIEGSHRQLLFQVCVTPQKGLMTNGEGSDPSADPLLQAKIGTFWPGQDLCAAIACSAFHDTEDRSQHSSASKGSNKHNLTFCHAVVAKSD